LQLLLQADVALRLLWYARRISSSMPLVR
jgi:hypothetical protein